MWCDVGIFLALTGCDPMVITAKKAATTIMNKAICTTIQGIVIPDVWDEMGNVLSVAVFTYQEEKIRVIDDPKGKALKNHIRKRVSVYGVMSPQGRSSAIRVRHYRIEDEPTDPVK